MKTFLAASAILCFCLAHAQQTDTTFQKVFYSPQAAYMAKTLAALEDDGVMILGELGWGMGALTRVDSAGTQLWTKRYGSSDQEINTNLHLKDMIKTHDTAFVSVGYVLETSNSEAYMAVMKTDLYGDTVWTARFNKSVVETMTATAVSEGVDSSIFLCGYGFQNGKGYLLKLDSLGTLLWGKELAESGSIEPYGVTQLSDGTIVMVGNRTAGIPGQGGFMLILDSDGNVQSARSISNAYLLDIIDHEGNLYLLASSGGTISLIKMDYSGNLIWKKGYYYTNVLDYSRKPYIRTLSDGNLMVMYGDRWYTTHLMILDQDGNIQVMQQHMFGGSDVLETKKKGLFMIGYGPLYGVRMLGYDHTGLVRMDSLYSLTGMNCAWESSLNISDPDIQFSTLTFSASSALVKTPLDLFYNVENLSEQPGCVEMWGGLDENVAHSMSASPNPTRDVVHFQQPEGMPFSVVIMDLKGRILLVDGELSAEKEINLSACGSGIYIYRVRFEDGTFSHGKIVVE